MQNKNNPQGFIPAHGGYRNLITFQKSEIIYDGTVYFTGRFFNKYNRTIDQMVQAARSGKQNIAEASMASATSKETEIKLTNVARASLEELLIDYEDFLRVALCWAGSFIRRGLMLPHIGRAMKTPAERQALN